MERENLRRFITYEDCDQFMIPIYAIDFFFEMHFRLTFLRSFT